MDDEAVGEIISDEAPFEEALDYEEMIDRLQGAVSKLPTDMRRVVELRFTEGLSARNVAEALNLSEANVRVLQHRALRKLREFLQ